MHQPIKHMLTKDVERSNIVIDLFRVYGLQQHHLINFTRLLKQTYLCAVLGFQLSYS